MKEEEPVLIETPKAEEKKMVFDFPDVEDPAQTYICDSCQ